MASTEKVTVMILEVDLKCSCCYKKVKKLLCKFPQIRDQVFDEDKNKVMIKVVCCDPEKLRDKLCCKGGRAIQSIEIVEKTKQPPTKPVVNKPNEPEKTKPPPPPTTTEKPKQIEKKTTPDLPPNKPERLPMPPVVQQPQPAPMPMPMPYPICPPVSTCCQECYQGLGGGPCHYGYGRPVPPPPGPSYDGYQYGGNRPCYTSRCDPYYFSDDNPHGCSIM